MIQDQPAKVILMHYRDPVIGGFGGPENRGRISELRKKKGANRHQENYGRGGGSSDKAGCANKQGGSAQDLESHSRAKARDKAKSRDQNSCNAAGRGERVHFAGGNSDLFDTGEEA